MCLLRLEEHATCLLHFPSACSSEAGSLSEPRAHILAHVEAGNPPVSSLLELGLRAFVRNTQLVTWVLDLKLWVALVVEHCS